jgi:hypothetical protein
MMKPIFATIISLAVYANCNPTNSASMPYPSKSTLDKCSFPAYQKQLCDRDHGSVVNYFELSTISNSKGEKIINVKAQRPLSTWNSLINLNKTPWTITGFENGGELTVRVSNVHPLVVQDSYERLARSGKDDPVLFQYGDVQWASDGEQMSESTSAWCEVKEWDVDEWTCALDVQVNSRVSAA